MTLPQHGDTIIFSRVPTASYCSEGVAYRVDRPANTGDFRFVNVERGSSTSDRPWAVRAAAWTKTD